MAVSSRAKNWCFTLHLTEPLPPGNAEDPLVVEPPGWPWTGVRFAACQAEQCPTSGRYHLQGYAQFEASKRLTQLKAILPGAHWEVARGSPDQNFEYCTKLETRVPGYTFFQFGEREAATRQGRACAVSDCVRFIAGNVSVTEAEVLEAYPSVWVRYPGLIGRIRSAQLGSGGLRDVRVDLYYGPTGTGKSALAYRDYPRAYRKPAGKWWDRYLGEQECIFDDYDGSWMPCTDLLRTLDRYPFLVEIKGNYTNLRVTHFIITTNIPIELWYSAHYEKHPEHLAALRRRITMVRHYTGYEEYTETPGAEYFAPPGRFTGYLNGGEPALHVSTDFGTLVSASPPSSPPLFVED